MKKISIMISFIIIMNLIAIQAIAKEKKIEYEKNGMIFVVGKHEPEKRVNPEKKDVEKVEQIIVHKHEEGKQTEGQKDRSNEFIENETEAMGDKLESGEEENIFAQWRESVWSITKDIVLNATAIFENAVDFLGRVTFMERVTFADKDMAGEAIIKKGEKEVRIEFKKPFIFVPVVTATPDGSFGHFALEDVTEKGFKIIIEEERGDEVKFKWIAIAVAGSPVVENKQVSPTNEK